jgi:X-Pro dipeptidyl-peptidase
MRRPWKVAIALAAMLLAGLLQAPAAPAAARALGTKRVNYVVRTKHGRIFVQVAHAVRGDKIIKAPAIFTYSPYSVLGVPPDQRRNNDASHWNPLGYHRVWADVVGTGNSSGCYDYGGNGEKETGAALVRWIARQKWSTGKVAMMGGSYEGTTATATAVERPKGLVTIVPEAAISRWYGYAFSGGIRYFLNNENPADEGFDTPLAFDFGLAVPPPHDFVEPGWAERVQSTMQPCEEVSHIEHGYDDTPDYGKFWRERDYLKDARKINIPVLVAHNWGDWNVKQEEGWNLFNALKSSRKRVLYFGTRFSGHGTPGGNYEKFVDAWMAHWLKGANNGIEKAPTFVSQTSNMGGPGKFLSANRFKTRNVTLYAQNVPQTTPDAYRWMLMPDKPGKGAPKEVAQFPSTNVNTEAHANHHSRQNHDWFWFETHALKRNTRIFGRPKVRIFSKTDQEWVTFTPTVVDVDPKCHQIVAGQHVGTAPECLPTALYSVTRGWLDSRYRSSLAKQKMLKPNKPFGITVVEKPTDYTFKKGHFIGLNIQTEINEWSIPKPYPCSSPDCVFVRVLWEKGQTRLVLPIVNAPRNPARLFQSPGHDH